LILLGLVFGAFAPDELWWRSRAFVGGCVSAAAFTAVALVSYAIAPDWMWMYFLDPADASWAVPLIPAAYMFVFALAFAAAVAVRRAARGLLWAAVGIAIGLEVTVISITWDRYHLVGSEREWLEGTAEELFSASPGGDAKTIGLLGPVFLAVSIVALVMVYRGRREATVDR
jgi:hypothetical protein